MFDDLCEELWNLTSLNRSVIDSLSRQLAVLCAEDDESESDANTSTLWDTLKNLMRQREGRAQLVPWFVLDRLLKEDPEHWSEIIPEEEFVTLATEYMPWFTSHSLEKPEKQDTEDIHTPSLLSQSHALLQSLGTFLPSPWIEQIREKTTQPEKFHTKSGFSKSLAFPSLPEDSPTEKGGELALPPPIPTPLPHPQALGMYTQQRAPKFTTSSSSTSTISFVENEIDEKNRTNALETKQTLNLSDHKLSVRSSESLLSVRALGSLAPPAPLEVPVVLPVPGFEAPPGHLVPPPEDHAATTRESLKTKLKAIFQRQREEKEKKRISQCERKTEEKDEFMSRLRDSDLASEFASASEQEEDTLEDREDEGNKQPVVSTRMHSTLLDFTDLTLPTEYPRDPLGVQIGNYPLGVKFLRDAIRQCGGAIELSRMERRVALTKDLRESIGDLRQFLEIHSATFWIRPELRPLETAEIGNRPEDAALTSKPLLVEKSPAGGVLSEKKITVLVVRVRGDALPSPGLEATYVHMRCPECDLPLNGYTLPRHRNSRLCCGIQLMKGAEGEEKTPIMFLAKTATEIAQKYHGEKPQPLEDSDLETFASALEGASEVPRFRYASSSQFRLVVLRGIMAIRNQWCSARGVNYVQDIVPFRWEERGVVSFFQTLGANLSRLPVPWIELGEMNDLCGAVCTKRKKPFPPPPRPADPRIRPRNEYPGFLFCEEGEMVEDANSEAELEYSDEEGAQYEYAPPVSVTQMVLAAGRTRETRKLAHFLRTAPGRPAARVKRNRAIEEEKRRVVEAWESYGFHHPEEWRDQEGEVNPEGESFSVLAAAGEGEKGYGTVHRNALFGEVFRPAEMDVDRVEDEQGRKNRFTEEEGVTGKVTFF